MKSKKHCRYCSKEISFKKTGIYRDYCGYLCYMDKQKENKPLKNWIK